MCVFVCGCPRSSIYLFVCLFVFFFFLSSTVKSMDESGSDPVTPVRAPGPARQLEQLDEESEPAASPSPLPPSPSPATETAPSSDGLATPTPQVDPVEAAATPPRGKSPTAHENGAKGRRTSILRLVSMYVSSSSACRACRSLAGINQVRDAHGRGRAVALTRAPHLLGARRA